MWTLKCAIRKTVEEKYDKRKSLGVICVNMIVEDIE